MALTTSGKIGKCTQKGAKEARRRGKELGKLRVWERRHKHPARQVWEGGWSERARQRAHRYKLSLPSMPVRTALCPSSTDEPQNSKERVSHQLFYKCLTYVTTFYHQNSVHRFMNQRALQVCLRKWGPLPYNSKFSLNMANRFWDFKQNDTQN